MSMSTCVWWRASISREHACVAGDEHGCGSACKADADLSPRPPLLNLRLEAAEEGSRWRLSLRRPAVLIFVAIPPSVCVFMRMATATVTCTAMRVVKRVPMCMAVCVVKRMLRCGPAGFGLH